MTGLVLVLALALSQASPAPTFGTSVSNVFVDAFVSSGGEPVSGLGPDDFELRDEGIVQRVTTVRREEVPLYVVLALDTSESVAGEKLKDLTAACRGFLGALAPRDRVTVLAFSHEIRVLNEASSGQRDAANQLSALEGHGATSLYDAADAALNMANREPHALVLIFTDGVDTSSWLRPEHVLKAAEASTSVVYAVGTNPEETRQVAFLKRLAEVSGGQLFWAGATQSLPGAFLKVLRDIRTRYILGYEPLGAAQEGWHSIAIRLRTKRGEVRARRGYFVRTPAG